MNIKLFLSFIMLVLGVLSASLTTAATRSSESLDRIVAIVNESVITQSELQKAIGAVKQQIAASNMALPTENILQKQVLDQLVNRKLQLQIAEQANVKVTENEMEEVINSIAKDHQINVNELYQKVSEQGLSKTEYRTQIREEMILQRIQQQSIGANLVVTPKEIDIFMRSKDWQAYNTKEYHVEDLLVSLPEAPTSAQITDAKQRAEKLLARIRANNNFREVAMSDSNNANALQGGDLGWRRLPEVPSAFSTHIIHMKADEILGPIQTSNGFHLIHLAGVRDTQTGKNGDERKQIEHLIFQRKLEEALQSWILRLRSSAYVDLNPKA